MSLQRRISLLLSMVVLLTSMAGIYILRGEVTDDIQKIVSKQQFALAERIAFEIDASIQRRLEDIQTVAKNTERNKNDFQKLQNYFHDGVWIVAPNGNPLTIFPDSNNGILKSKVYFDFMNILRYKEWWISDPFMVGEIPIVLFGARLHGDQGPPQFVIGAVNSLRSTLIGNLQNMRIGDSGYAYLFNPRTRQLILHPDRFMDVVPPGKNSILDQGIGGFEGTRVTVNSQGMETLTSIKAIPSTGWIVGLNFPVQESMLPVDKLRQKLAVLVGMGGIALLFLVYMGSLHITRPLNKLREQFEKSAKDLENAEPLPILNHNELGQLTATYNLLLTRFQEEIRHRNTFENILKTKEAFLRDIMETMGDAVVVCNPTGQLLYLNPQASQWLGLNERTMNGRNIQEWVRFDTECSWFEDSREDIVKPVNMDAEIHTHSGMNIPVSATLNPILKLQDSNNGDIQSSRDNPEFHGWVLSLHDIREAKRIQAELQKSREMAESANRAKSEFLAHMSHEIRTPMTGIMGMTEMLIHNCKLPESLETLRVIQQSAGNLLSIINDILDLSKIESGHLNIVQQPFLLPEMLKEIGMWGHIQCQQKGLRFRIAMKDIPEAVVGDSSRIRQILLNLIGNALKFTEKGEILLHVQQRDNHVEFHVKDTGIGIPHHKLHAIFDAFQQADNFIERKYGGTGLGLTICRNLSKAMGGDIHVQSSPGEGSHFMVKFPFEQADPAQVDRQNLLHVQKRTACRILVAEDNPINTKYLEWAIQQLGHKVKMVINGRQAVEVLQKEHFDLVFMDIQMPEMNGFEATKTIRDMGVQVPIVGLSAHAMEGFREEVLEKGFTDFLVKPITRNALSMAISKISGDVATEENDSVNIPSENPLHALQQTFGLDRQEFQQFIALLETHLQEGIEKLQSIKKERNRESLRELSHGLKSTFGVMGIQGGVHSISVDIEQLCKHTDGNPWERLQEFESALNDLKMAVEQWKNESLS